MSALATTRAARQVLARTGERLELALALLEAADAEAPLWAHRQRAQARQILREAQTEIAGPAIAARPSKAA